MVNHKRNILIDKIRVFISYTFMLYCSVCVLLGDYYMAIPYIIYLFVALLLEGIYQRTIMIALLSKRNK